ncbi:hypothetical protein [Parafrigoribacterium soli]|uniref:hypothetical protein n=1 Tax=Parafrigoribacterium soli TaxID=3144663 RepID=UPI0032ED986A
MDELRRLDNTHDSMDEPLGAAAAVPRERAVREPRALGRTGRTFDMWAAGLLTLAQLVFSAMVSFLALLNQFNFDSCSDPQLRCNFTLGGFAFAMVPVAGALIFVLTVVVIVVRHRRARPAWWIPVAGAGASVIALVVSILLTAVAVGRPPW